MKKSQSSFVDQFVQVCTQLAEDFVGFSLWLTSGGKFRPQYALAGVLIYVIIFTSIRVMVYSALGK